jgi:hypothetical protein
MLSYTYNLIIFNRKFELRIPCRILGTFLVRGSGVFAKYTAAAEFFAHLHKQFGEAGVKANHIPDRRENGLFAT